MLPYILTYIIVLLLFHQYDKSRGGKKVFLYAGVVVLAILAGCRDSTIGTDTDGYVQLSFEEAVRYKNDFVGYYTFLVLAHSGFEPLYILLNFIVAQFTDCINVYLFVAHILIVGVMVQAIKRTGINATWPMFIFLMAFMANTLNVARQSLAMAFCYFAFAQLITGSRMKWVLLTNLIALGFHHSAFFFLVPIVGYKLVTTYPHVFDTRKMKFVCIFGSAMFIWFFSEILSI